MDILVIASTRKNAGKTSMIIGLAQAMKREFGYIKPFGDRLFYRKKRLWDYDAALVVNTFNLESDPEEMSLAFDHAKIRYMYDEAMTKERLSHMISVIGENKALVFVEGGENLTYGASVYLDAISVARHTDGMVILVVSGEDGTIMDDLSFVRRYVDLSGVNIRGVILNKVQDPDDFRETYLASVEQMGFSVIGMIPFTRELTYVSVSTLIERLFVKVIAGEGGVANVVKNIFVGAMSGEVVRQDPLFRREAKLIITGGDRSDMIAAALESDTACIILTNNIVPTPAILAKASEKNIPLLLASEDTYQIATQIDSMDVVVSKSETEKIAVLGGIVHDYINIEKIL